MDDDGNESLDEAMNEDLPPARGFRGAAGAAAEADADSLALPNAPSGALPTLPLPATSDEQRQRNLEEALLLQMDMQRRLHDQLEVGGGLLGGWSGQSEQAGRGGWSCNKRCWGSRLAFLVIARLRRPVGCN